MVRTGDKVLFVRWRSQVSLEKFRRLRCGDGSGFERTRDWCRWIISWLEVGMGRIDVNPAELRRAARECEAASSRLSAVAGDVGGTLGRMRWQGRSRSEYDHRHSAWQSSARRQVDNLERLARELNQAAQRLEEAERLERLERERRNRR